MQLSSNCTYAEQIINMAQTRKTNEYHYCEQYSNITNNTKARLFYRRYFVSYTVCASVYDLLCVRAIRAALHKLVYITVRIYSVGSQNWLSRTKL